MWEGRRLIISREPIEENSQHTFVLEQQPGQGIDTGADHVRRRTGQTGGDHHDVLFHRRLRRCSSAKTRTEERFWSDVQDCPPCTTVPPWAILLAITTNKSNPASRAFSFTSLVPSTASERSSGMSCRLSVGMMSTIVAIHCRRSWISAFALGQDRYNSLSERRGPHSPRWR